MNYDIDSLHDAARPFYSLNLLTPRERFLAKATIHTHRQLKGFKIDFPDMALHREPGRIGAYDTDYILVETYMRGETRGVVSNQQTFVSREVVHCIDWSRPYTAVMRGDVEGVAVHVPHGLIGYDPSQHAAYRSLPVGSAQGRLLALSLNNLISEMGRDSEAFEVLAAATIGLVKALLVGGEDWCRDPEHDNGRRCLIERYIDQNLKTFDLSVERIGRELGMSRATLYRCFGKGGIDRVVREKRLDQCLVDLARAAPERGQVCRVAGAWGFHEPGNFNRAFRSRFGASPSDCVGVSGLESQDFTSDLSLAQ